MPSAFACANRTISSAVRCATASTAAASIGFTVGLATMAGDLWESALKRRFGVKDAGSIIPGHGGLLDRVDGMMFAVVVIAAARLAIILMERAA